MDVTNASVADIDTATWYNWQQQAVPVLLDLTFEACGEAFRTKFGLPFFTSVLWYRTEGEHTEVSWLLRNDEGIALGRLLSDVLAVPSAADSVEREFARACDELLALCGTAEAVAADQSSVLLRTVCRAFLDFYAVGAITEPVQFFAEHAFSRWLDADRSITEATGIDSATVLSALTATSEEMYATAIHREMLTLAVNAIDEESLASGCAAHAERYSWKTNNYGRARVVTPDEVRTEVLRLRSKDPADELHKLSDSMRTSAARRAVVLQAAPEAIRSLSLLAERFGTVMADRRKAVMNQALAGIQGLARVRSEQIGLEWVDAVMLSPSELANDAADRDDLARRATERRQGYVQVLAPWPLDDAEMLSLLSVSDGAASWALPRSEAASVHESLAAFEALRDLDRRMRLFVSTGSDDLVVGSVVQVEGLDLAKVTAPAKVVLDPVRDASKFNDGDVLVATSTTADFLPLMNRASAIVTNMGGMFQHAAQFAREHKLACIIGSGSATAVFVDGDIVDVDLSDGSVRRHA